MERLPSRAYLFASSDGCVGRRNILWSVFYPVDAYGSWTLVEHVPIERYLNGVVPYEIGASFLKQH